MAADSNRTGLAYVKEVAWGTNPATTMADLRWTGESFSYNLTKTKSTEIRSDRQSTDLILTGAECSGGFNFELSYSDFDEFMTGALWSAGWSTASTIGDVATDIGFDVGGRIYREAGTFSSLTTGQWIEVSGATAATNNGYFRITSTASTGLEVVPAVSTMATGDPVVIKGSYIRNGTTESSYTFERSHGDVAQYFDFTGMVANTLNLTVSADAIVTGSLDFIGKGSTLVQATGGTGSNTAAGTYDVISASSNVGDVFEGAFASLATIDSDLYVQEISFTVANNVRGLRAIANVANVDIGVGACDVSGSINVYFIDSTMYDKFIASSGSGLSFVIEDASGNAYIFTFPNVEFSTDAINTSGQNQDVMENIGWEALRDSNTDCTIQIDKFAA
jgi:hypothetical protein